MICKNNMASVLKSTNRRLNFVLHFILWGAIVCFIFDLSGATSFSQKNQRSSIPDGFQSADYASDSWDETTLLQGSSQKILEAQFFEASIRKRELQGGANEIRTGIQLKLIHRTSLLSPHSNTQSAKIDILKELLELDAARLMRGYRLSSSSSGNPQSGYLASTNAVRKKHKAADVAHTKYSSESANNRISSGSTLGSGQYFVDFYMGTPARRYSLIADTGSDLIWVQCYPCSKCYPQSNPIYYPNKSSSFSSVSCSANQCFLVPAPTQASCSSRFPTSCQYTYIYNDGSSTSGFLASETVTMISSSGESLKISNITFGCGVSNAGQSLRGSNGVLGLGQGPVSFASQLGYLYGSRFSYCLVDYLTATADSSLLVFGDAKIEQSLKNAIQYTPLVKNPFAESYYYVGIKHVCLNGQILPIPSKLWQITSAGYGGTIVDSGTTLTYFRNAAYSLIVAAFQRAIPVPRVAPIQGLDLCFNFSAASGINIPEFSILLEGDVLFQPPPENYFVDTALGVKCLAMQGVDSPLGSNTIGNLLQQNFHVEFDRSNARLGFVWANCSSSS
ncbi:hypothetical protein O6H91_20G054400 [Diphasiastrum complanatum]|uniref:Uncharacterized protein n=1 Tax=Diphasiastrum complanatum TaxID=34168 RepID=A0ACC2AQF2_DIPCM|nr:hypothetical protein O6H91_20G054400 [Diphasiastrum complanatum]